MPKYSVILHANSFLYMDVYARDEAAAEQIAYDVYDNPGWPKELDMLMMHPRQVLHRLNGPQEQIWEVQSRNVRIHDVYEQS